MRLRLLRTKISKMQSMNWIKENWRKFKEMVFVSWVIQHTFITIFSIVAVILFVFIACLFFNFEGTMSVIGMDTKNITDKQWTLIKNVAYAFGASLLIIQISISNRRADAAEETAKAASGSNAEQRYHNATNHLANENPVIRIGAIYNLYHISQTTDTYDTTIFDMFCEYLSRSENAIVPKERQIIVDRLFKGEIDKRVLKKPVKIDLTNTDLTGANLTGADLTDADLTDANLKGANLTGANLKGADLTRAKLDSCVFEKVNLIRAKLPSDLTGVKSMKGAKLDEVEFYTGSKLKGLQLSSLKGQNGSLKNAKILYADLSDAKLMKVDLTGTDLTGTDLTGANLTGTKGLTFEQLSTVKCLYDVKGLKKELEQKLRAKNPKLFDKLS